MKWPAALLSLAILGSALGAEPGMFRGDARHAGVYPGAGVPVLHGVKWKFKTGGAVLATPVLAGGTVYFGSSDHNFYALDAASGALRWKFATHGRVTSSAAVAAGRVYFGSYDSNFYALDAASGALLWKFASGGERRFSARHLHGAEPAAEVMPDPFDTFLSSPVLADGAVYFGSGDGNVYALDAATGALRWKFATGDVVHASPALAAGTLYVGSWDSYFYALDACQRQAALALQDRRGRRHQQPGGHPVLRGGRQRRRLLRLPRLAPVRARCRERRAALGLSQQGLMGDHLSGGSGRRGVLRHLGQCAAAGRGRQERRAIAVARLPPLAVLLLAGARRRPPLHRLGLGQGVRARPQDASARVDVRHRRRHAERRAPDQGRRHAELRGGLLGLLLRRHGGRHYAHAGDRLGAQLAGTGRRHAYFGSSDGQLYAIG